MSDQTRPIYLIVYPSRLFPAHWAFWVPAYNQGTNEVYNVGKRIEVDGNPSEGFVHSITRNHNVASSRNPPIQVLLGYTWGVNIADGMNEGAEYVDNAPTDLFEEWALYIPAPGPSLRSVGPSSASGSSAQEQAPRRVQLENCQTWCAQVVDTMINKGILGPEARDALNSAPRN